MADLSVKYLGLRLKTPLVVSSNPLCEDVENLRHMERAGAGAVVLTSLFEEQLTLEQSESMRHPDRTDIVLPPALQHIPDMKGYNKGAGGYVVHLHQAKQALTIPVIASLNGSSEGGWISYAKVLEAVGADALELNVYYLPTTTDSPGTELEERFLRLVRAVREQVQIPVAVKLNPYFSSIPYMASRLAEAGADALVLFNRFYQPDFDLDTETVVPSLELSNSSELRLRLRWVAILYGRVQADLAVTGGVHTGADAIKALLAGASVAMMASALLEQGIGHLATVRSDVERWLDEHGYASVADMHGRMSQRNVSAPAALERANYVQVLHSYGSDRG